MLHRNNLTPDRVVDAGKERIAGEEAWRLLAGVKEIVVARGKKYLPVDPHQAGREAVLEQVLGRTGFLRAPTLRMGDRLLVGYSDALYAHYVG